jgi:hypothetical protein
VSVRVRQATGDVAVDVVVGRDAVRRVGQQRPVAELRPIVSEPRDRGVAELGQPPDRIAVLDVPDGAAAVRFEAGKSVAERLDAPGIETAIVRLAVVNGRLTPEASLSRRVVDLAIGSPGRGEESATEACGRGDADDPPLSRTVIIQALARVDDAEELLLLVVDRACLASLYQPTTGWGSRVLLFQRPV